MKKYQEGGQVADEVMEIGKAMAATKKKPLPSNEKEPEKNIANRAMDAAQSMGKRLKKNILGDAAQNAKAEEDEKRRARENPEGNEAKFRRMMGKEFKAGGKVSKEVMEKAGFYDKDKNKQERQKIVNKVTTKPQRVAMVEKMFSSKNMKSGGTVSASSRADGCAQRGKTKGRMV